MVRTHIVQDEVGGGVSRSLRGLDPDFRITERYRSAIVDVAADRRWSVDIILGSAEPAGVVPTCSVDGIVLRKTDESRQ